MSMIYTFICIIYPGKHNGTLLLTYETHSKQLEQNNDILDQKTAVTPGDSRVEGSFLKFPKYDF